ESTVFLGQPSVTKASLGAAVLGLTPALARPASAGPPALRAPCFPGRDRPPPGSRAGPSTARRASNPPSDGAGAARWSLADARPRAAPRRAPARRRSFRRRPPPPPLPGPPPWHRSRAAA